MAPAARSAPARNRSARAWRTRLRPGSSSSGRTATEVGLRQSAFVARLGPANCYGLYAGEGPAYCSGNQTVFVGTREANRLMARFGARGEAGITFLIGHEMGHHIQNIYGRFHFLNHVIARAPGAPRLISCAASSWRPTAMPACGSTRARHGPSPPASGRTCSQVLASIGDDRSWSRMRASARRREGVHGTSAQRTRWFVRGAGSGDWRACNVFSAASPSRAASRLERVAAIGADLARQPLRLHDLAEVLGFGRRCHADPRPVRRCGCWPCR